MRTAVGTAEGLRAWRRMWLIGRCRLQSQKASRVERQGAAVPAVPPPTRTCKAASHGTSKYLWGLLTRISNSLYSTNLDSKDG